MIYFSFEYDAFNKGYEESHIDIVVASKYSYEDGLSFLNDALKYMDEEVCPGDGFLTQYDGLHLKDGTYRDIVQHWIDSMDCTVQMRFHDICKIQRIKCGVPKPLQEEFLIETKDEYIMFLWECTA